MITIYLKNHSKRRISQNNNFLRQLFYFYVVIMLKGILKEVEDMQLARACLDGNEKAQAQLFRLYSRQMMAVCMRYAGNYEQAQDMLQEGFVKVFNRLDIYRGDGPLGAWIRRTMINTALDIIRKEAREQKHIDKYEVEVQIEAELEERSMFDNEEEFSEVELMEMIQQLPAGYRTVFNLYAVEELSHKEISEMLDITESTSRSQYRKAKASLRRLIKEELNKRFISD